MEGDVKARGPTGDHTAATRLARAAPRVSKRKRAQSVADDARPAMPERHEAERVGRDEIAVRAYEIYLTRGSAGGHDLDDWLQAERELCFPPLRG